MDNSVIGDHSFEGPYFSSHPRGLCQSAWRAERRPAHSDDAALAGGWYAVGRGALQNAGSIAKLRSAEAVLRRQQQAGHDCNLALGVNLAAQGIGLAGLKMYGAAVPRLEEALALHRLAGNPHLCDLAEIAVCLATATYKIHGPWVALARLEELEIYLVGLNHSALMRAIELRLDLLVTLEQDGPAQRLEAYRDRGFRLQQDDPEFKYYFEDMHQTLRQLFIDCQEHVARRLSTMVLRELLLNRNLEISTMQTVLHEMTPMLVLLEELRKDLKLPRSAMREAWIWQRLSFVDRAAHQS